jgi:hypothetical protein
MAADIFGGVSSGAEQLRPLEQRAPAQQHVHAMADSGEYTSAPSGAGRPSADWRAGGGRE